MSDTFKPFPSIPRLSKDMTITEKIDGTNACIVVLEDGTVHAQSRSRTITFDNDNHGFAKWVEEHKEELKLLGVGYHFGEWWGGSIQRGYGTKEKRFSLFYFRGPGEIPPCVSMVPVLYKGPFSTEKVEEVMAQLKEHGSYAIPFMDPEGICIFHEGSRQLYKKTFEGDAGKFTLRQ